MLLLKLNQTRQFYTRLDILPFRVIHSGTLARELFGFDGERIVLLHGYVKRTGEPASQRDLNKASDYWKDYQKTRRVSPVQEEETANE